MSLWLLVALSGKPLAAADAPGEWRGFLGGCGNVALGAKLPVKWSVETGENIAWTAELPGRGVSSPIVVAGRVIVTCSSGEPDGPEENLHVLAFGEASGERLWQRDFKATGRTKINEATAVAGSTPVTDGERVYCLFSSNDLVAVDLEGEILWELGLAKTHPQAGNDFGMASSPVMAGKRVIVQCDGSEAAFVAGVDPASGEIAWERERKAGGSWSTPLVIPWQFGGKAVEAVMFQAAEGIEALDAATGELLWKEELPCETIPSPIVVDRRLYVAAKSLVALEREGAGEEWAVSWKGAGIKPSAATPVVHEGWAYGVGRGGLLSAAKVGSDEVSWKLRLGGTVWATPLLADGRLYCVNGDGAAFVVELGDEGRVSYETSFGEPILASPAVSGDAMFVRGHKHLWKIAE